MQQVFFSWWCRTALAVSLRLKANGKLYPASKSLAVLLGREKAPGLYCTQSRFIQDAIAAAAQQSDTARFAIGFHPGFEPNHAAYAFVLQHAGVIGRGAVVVMGVGFLSSAATGGVEGVVGR